MFHQADIPGRRVLPEISVENLSEVHSSDGCSKNQSHRHFRRIQPGITEGFRNGLHCKKRCFCDRRFICRNCSAQRWDTSPGRFPKMDLGERHVKPCAQGMAFGYAAFPRTQRGQILLHARAYGGNHSESRHENLCHLPLSQAFLEDMYSAIVLTLRKTWRPSSCEMRRP